MDVKELYEKTKVKFNDIKKKIEETPKEDLRTYCLIGVGALAGITKIGKMIHRSKVVKAEEFLKNRKVYDRSLGMYWTLCRNMRPSEQQLFALRKASGEPVGAILQDMHLL